MCCSGLLLWAGNTGPHYSSGRHLVGSFGAFIGGTRQNPCTWGIDLFCHSQFEHRNPFFLVWLAEWCSSRCSSRCCDIGPLLHRSPLPRRPLLLWAQPSRLLHQGSTCFCCFVICGLVFLDVIFFFFGEFRTSKNYLLVPLSFLILGCSNIFLPVFEFLLVVNLNNPRDIPQSIIKIRNRLVQKTESKTYGCIQGSWNNGNASKGKRDTSDLSTSVWMLAEGLGSMQWSRSPAEKAFHPGHPDLGEAPV